VTFCRWFKQPKRQVAYFRAHAATFPPERESLAGKALRWRRKMRFRMRMDDIEIMFESSALR